MSTISLPWVVFPQGDNFIKYIMGNWKNVSSMTLYVDTDVFGSGTSIPINVIPPFGNIGISNCPRCRKARLDITGTSLQVMDVAFVIYSKLTTETGDVAESSTIVMRADAPEGTTMQEVPFNQGYAGNFPVKANYWVGHNMVPKGHRGWKCRPTYQQYTPTETPYALHQLTNNNYIMIGSHVYSGSPASGWTQCGSVSSINSSGQIATFSSSTYPNKAMFAPRSYTKAPVRIDYASCTSATHTTIPDYGSSLKCTVQHGNRAILSTKSTIFYSAVGDYWTDLDGTNYVTVGQNDEDITGLLNVSGNLYIFKENSVWVKIGWQSAFDDYSFRKIYDVESCCDHACCAMAGAIAYANLSGVYILTGDQSHCISKDVEEEWQSRANASTMYISYWPSKKWILAEPNAQSTNGPLVYDVQAKVWFPFFGISLTGAATISNPNANSAFVTGSSTKIQVWSDSPSVPAETTIEQYLKTSRVSLATPHGTQYLSRVFLYGSNITTLKVYLYNSYGGYTTLTTTSPNPITVFNLPPAQEIEIECIGSGTMIVDSIAIECYTRRLK